MTVYACGFHYDDFSEGGFSVFAICDSEESAKKAIEKARAELPLMNRNHFDYKTYKVNKYYSNR